MDKNSPKFPVARLFASRKCVAFQGAVNGYSAAIDGAWAAWNGGLQNQTWGDKLAAVKNATLDALSKAAVTFSQSSIIDEQLPGLPAWKMRLIKTALGLSYKRGLDAIKEILG